MRYLPFSAREYNNHSKCENDMIINKDINIKRKQRETAIYSDDFFFSIVYFVIDAMWRNRGSNKIYELRKFHAEKWAEKWIK